MNKPVYRYYRHNPANDPKGPGPGRIRVNRGGSWNNVAWYLRSARRSHDSPGSRYVIPGYRSVGLGFRLVRQP